MDIIIEAEALAEETSALLLQVDGAAARETETAAAVAAAGSAVLENGGVNQTMPVATMAAASSSSTAAAVEEAPDASGSAAMAMAVAVVAALSPSNGGEERDNFAMKEIRELSRSVQEMEAMIRVKDDEVYQAGMQVEGLRADNHKLEKRAADLEEELEASRRECERWKTKALEYEGALKDSHLAMEELGRSLDAKLAERINPITEKLQQAQQDIASRDLEIDDLKKKLQEKEEQNKFEALVSPSPDEAQSQKPPEGEQERVKLVGISSTVVDHEMDFPFSGFDHTDGLSYDSQTVANSLDDGLSSASTAGQSSQKINPYFVHFHMTHMAIKWKISIKGKLTPELTYALNQMDSKTLFSDAVNKGVPPYEWDEFILDNLKEIYAKNFEIHEINRGTNSSTEKQQQSPATKWPFGSSFGASTKSSPFGNVFSGFGFRTGLEDSSLSRSNSRDGDAGSKPVTSTTTRSRYDD